MTYVRHCGVKETFRVNQASEHRIYDEQLLILLHLGKRIRNTSIVGEASSGVFASLSDGFDE